MENLGWRPSERVFRKTVIVETDHKCESSTERPGVTIKHAVPTFQCLLAAHTLVLLCELFFQPAQAEFTQEFCGLNHNNI